MKLVLAPLAGFTNAPFRRLCASHGADYTVTEMVSAAGLAHGSSPTRHLMEVLPGEGPVAVQLFGNKPDELAFAAREIVKLNRFIAIDFNTGCPMPKIMHEGSGAALLRDPQLIHDCLKAIKSEAGNVPVTLKTRPGIRPEKCNMIEILRAAEEAGVSGIALHARYRVQAHSGEVHLDLLAEMVESTKLPITGNGSVTDRASLKAMLATGVDAVMIGRAAIGNPFIFEDLKATEPVKLTQDEIFARKEKAYEEHFYSLMEFHRQLTENFPNDHIPSIDGFISVAMHTMLFRYFNGRPGAVQLRKKLNSVRTLDGVYEAIAEIRSRERQP